MTIFKDFCNFVGFSSILNILRNLGKFKKLRAWLLVIISAAYLQKLKNIR